MVEVSAPMFISGRLMAALKIDGVGTIHIEPVSYDSEGRLTWRYIVEDRAGHVLCDQADIKDAPAQPVNATATMECLLGFMGAAADAYRPEMQHGEGSSENGDLFPPAMMEWCYLNDDEIGSAMFDLTFDGSED